MKSGPHYKTLNTGSISAGCQFLIIFWCSVQNAVESYSVEWVVHPSKMVDSWTRGFVNLWIRGFVDSWIHGFVNSWNCGFVDLWICGIVDLWICGFVEV